MKPMCGNCYFAAELIGNDQAIACHRYPPEITKVEALSVTSTFPLLGIKEWCGEWIEGNKQWSPVKDKVLPVSGKAVSRGKK